MDKNKTIIKAFRLSTQTDNILNEASAELCLSKVDIIRLLLNASANNLKADAIKAGGFSNLNFSLIKNKDVPKQKHTFKKDKGLLL